MKNILFNKTIAYTAIILIAVSISSCKKGFDEINDDPNNPKDVPTSYLLTGAEKGLMDNNWDHWWDGSMGNQLAQYWSSNQYTSESRYQFRTGIVNSYWTLFYAGGNNDALSPVGGLEELQTIINLCTENPAKYSPYGFPANQIAVATILKVWQMQMLTDAWGAVPYSKALLGIKNPQPSYDKQEDIYTGLLAELDHANAIIDENQNGPSGDVIYGGDMLAWRKFGNSLKLRVAIRIADRNPIVAAAKINEAVTSGVFTSNADNATFKYLNGNPNTNLHNYDYENQGRNDFCGSNTMVDLMNGLADPRLGIYFDPIANDTNITYIGEVYGLTEANGANTDDGDVSQRGAAVVAADAPGLYMGYAEVKFILAEAAERGFGVGDAASDYEGGISASMEYWGVDATEAATYIARPDVAYGTAAGNWKEKIGKQKWLALYMQGMEAWAEWRRLDFGILQQPADGVLDGVGIPVRLKYPVEEQTLNGSSYSAAVSNQGPDDLTTKVWWDMY